MKEIEAVINPSKVESLKAGLSELGITSMTICEVEDFDYQNCRTRLYRGTEYKINFVPRIKVMIMVADDQTDLIVKRIIEDGRTGSIGDEMMISVHPIEKIYWIGTDEIDRDAV